jgi:hypothetical protein
LAAVLSAAGWTCAQERAAAQESSLPNAPSALLAAQAAAEEEQQTTGETGAAPVQMKTTPAAKQRPLRLCTDRDYPPLNAPATPPVQTPPPCRPENPLQPIVSTRETKPLTSKDKGRLAMRNFMDPFNFVTVAGYSAVAIAANSHSAYGPGFRGFAKLTGYGLAEDAQGEFLETYAIPSLVREDPRYHRMPEATFQRRLWHAIEHTYVSQHDEGRAMPNYATLLTYPITAEISNLYVPGIQTDLPTTAKRVGIGLATDPSGAIVAEFLPDVARRIHIRIVFVQEILNRMIVGAPTTTTVAAP